MATIAPFALDCFGDDDGELTVVVEGGTAPYTYVWTPNVSTTATATGLTAGSYEVEITDANNCTTTATGVVTEPTELTLDATIVDVDCNGAADGSITPIVTGGTTPYTYDWADIDGTDDGANRTDLAGGDYDLTVTDANGCTVDATFTVDDGGDIVATMEDFVLDCFGDEDGVLTVTLTGATAPITYVWTPNVSTGATADGLAVGTYTVSITDATGCTATATAEVTAPAAIALVADATGETCNGVEDGSIDLMVSGGTMPYTYEWSNDSTSQDISGLAAGVYTVTVTDANNCTETITGTVLPGEEFEVTVANDTVCPTTPATPGTLTAVPTTAGDYTYVWSTTAVTQSITESPAVTTTYSVTVTDTETGCETVAEGTIVVDPTNCCDLEAAVTVAPDCDDNGTPTDPSDDFYTVTVLVSGTSPSGTVTDNFGNTLTVGTPFTYTFDASDNDPLEIITANYVDPTSSSCTATTEWTELGSCSDQCAISVDLASTPECFDNGTDTDPDDDQVTFEIIVDGDNAVGSGWTATYNNNVVATGAYDQNTPVFILSDDIPGNTVLLLITDNDNPGCETQLSVPVSDLIKECSFECFLRYETAAVFCDPGETLSDPTDDVYFVQVQIFVANAQGWTGGGYTGNNAPGLYTFGPFNGPTASITIFGITQDGIQDDCTLTIEENRPADFPCSNECEVEGDVLSVRCDDNGTPQDSLDDVYFVTATATPIGGTNDAGWVYRDGRTNQANSFGPFAYGSTQEVGPFPIFDANGDRIASVEHRIHQVSRFNCGEIVEVVPPAPCSDEPLECDIDIEIVDRECNNQGTGDLDDDTYSATILVTGFTGNYTITVLVPGGFADITGTFGVEQTIEGIPVAVNFQGRVTANGDTDCFGVFLIQSTGPCGDCDILVEELAAVCDDNGTADPSDDTFSQRLVITNNDSTLPGWMVTLPGTNSPVFGSYGDTITINGLIADGSFEITFMDMVNRELCREPVIITPPTSCSPCELTATVEEGECDNNGTPFDASDDFFIATITVTGENAGASWTATGGQETYTGSIGTSTEIVLPADGSITTLTIVSDNDADCSDELVINHPSSCADEVPCDINVTVNGDEVCTDDGDAYTVSVTVTNSGTGSVDGWTANGIGIAGAYGQTVTITITDLSGPIEVTFEDVSDQSCNETVTFTPPTIEIVAPADTSTLNGIDFLCAEGDMIFEQQNSLTITGDATLTGCGIATFGFIDTYISGNGGQEGEPLDCDDTVIERVFFAIGEDGTTVRDTQLITIRKPLVSDVIFPTDTIDFDCEVDDFPTDANGNPATAVTGEPIVVSAFDTTILTDLYCGNISVSYSDASEQTCSGTQTIVRTWTAEDLCTGATTTSEQIIRTGDFSAPVVECPISNHFCPILEENIMLWPMDDHECFATFEVPVPEVTDVCSDSWTIRTVILDADGTIVATIEAGDDREVMLEGGDYTVRYIVTDDCGNAGITDCIIRVADTQEPTAACISDINVSVGGFGRARIYTGMIDIGSYDNCGLDSILVRRQYVIDPITGDTLDEPIWSDWSDYAVVDCEDVGTTVTVQLRVTDFGGNANVCTTNAMIVDNTLPLCTGLEDQFLSCSDIPSDFDASDTLDLRALFGMPTVIDNCAAEAMELTPILNIDLCGGAGTIVRRWLAIDDFGNVSADVFTQTITIDADQNFTLVLPQDTLTDCIEEFQGFEIIGESCADLDVTYTDRMVDVTDTDGEACMVIERTYVVINNCQYTDGADTVVLSRDADCDEVMGERYFAIVTVDSTYADVDGDRFNALPGAGTTDCAEGTNPEGYLNRVANTGAWSYVQRIAIIDETAPELIYTQPDVFCATEEEDCQTMIRIPITVENECTAVGANWQILVDLNRDGGYDMQLPASFAITGTFPNYAVEAMLPLGDHSVTLRYIDGCQNGTSTSIDFTVVDCSIPDPTCYDGLIANLDVLDVPVVLADGKIIDNGVYVDAGVLASCNIDDCSGNLRFSVNRIGDTPNVDSTTVLLTCDDRYTVKLEVYMWDRAFNPMAVQPDSSIGGPNWKMCVVEVLVQDPKTLCEDCNADGSLSLGGDISLPSGLKLPNVEVELDGGRSALELTDNDGAYLFEGLQPGDYTITPYREDDAANGVSTLDELILQRHLLGIAPITDPFVFMAADLNGSGTITVLDRLILRNIILGNTEVLPGGSTWRFVPARYAEELGDRLGRNAEVPRDIKIEAIESCAFGHDFIAIKLGDLNGSVFIRNIDGDIINGTRGRSSRDVQELEIEERRLQGGELFEIPVRARNLEAIAGLQFSLELTPGVSLVEVVPGLMTESQIGLRYQQRGILTANWLQPTDRIAGDAILLTLKVRSNTTVNLREVLEINGTPTVAEAYRADDLDLMDLSVVYTRGEETFDPSVPTIDGEIGATLELEQNSPNPFRETTTIRFNLPEAGTARLSVYDLSGRVLQEIEQRFEAGENSVTLDGRRFAAGTMVYSLNFKGEKLSRGMVHLQP